MRITLREIVQIPFFAPFKETPGKLKALMQFSRILNYEDQELVIREGDEDDGALFVILSGAVVIAKTIDWETGRAKPLAILRKGEFFGEMSLFDASPRSANVLASGSCYLLKIDRAAFMELVQADAELSINLMSSVIHSVSNRLRRTNMELVVLYDTGRIISRVHRLHDMCGGVLQRLCSSLGSAHGVVYLFNDLSNSYDRCGVHGEISLNEVQLQWIHGNIFENHGLRLPEAEGLEHVPSFDWENLLVAPLTIKGHIYGSIVLMRSSGSYTDAEYNLAMGVANQASFAVENARNREEEAAREAYQRRRRG